MGLDPEKLALAQEGLITGPVAGNVTGLEALSASAAPITAPRTSEPGSSPEVGAAPAESQPRSSIDAPGDQAPVSDLRPTGLPAGAVEATAILSATPVEPVRISVIKRRKTPSRTGRRRSSR